MRGKLEQKEDDFSLMFWKQTSLSFGQKKKLRFRLTKTWVQLSKEEQIAYKRVLGGLTLLDTKQGGEGMPLVLVHLENFSEKCISFHGSYGRSTCEKL